jgi:hypothetical protein
MSDKLAPGAPKGARKRRFNTQQLHDIAMKAVARRQANLARRAAVPNVPPPRPTTQASAVSVKIAKVPRQPEGRMLGEPVRLSNNAIIIEPQSGCAPNLAEAQKFDRDARELQVFMKGWDARYYDRKAGAMPIAELKPAIDRWAESKGYKYLGGGISRMGYLILERPTCVVKFGYNVEGGRLDGVQGNKKEVADYIRVSPQVRALLAHVAAYSEDGNWVVMPKVKTVGDTFQGRAAHDFTIAGKTERLIDSDDAVRAMEKALRDAGAMIGDLHQNNLAVTDNGTLVVLDWGFGIRIVEPKPKAESLAPGLSSRFMRRHGEGRQEWQRRMQAQFPDLPGALGVNLDDLYRPPAENTEAWRRRVNKLVQNVNAQNLARIAPVSINMEAFPQRLRDMRPNERESRGEFARRLNEEAPTNIRIIQRPDERDAEFSARLFTLYKNLPALALGNPAWQKQSVRMVPVWPPRQVQQADVQRAAERRPSELARVARFNAGIRKPRAGPYTGLKPRPGEAEFAFLDRLNEVAPPLLRARRGTNEDPLEYYQRLRNIFGRHPGYVEWKAQQPGGIDMREIMNAQVPRT